MSDANKIRNLLMLYDSNELSASERRRADELLRRSPEARQMLEEIRALYTKLREAPHYEAEPATLHRLRERLHDRLLLENPRQPAWQKLASWLSDFQLRPAWQLAIAAATLVLGVAIGRQTSRPASLPVAAPAPAGVEVLAALLGNQPIATESSTIVPSLANVRKIKLDPVSHQIEIEFSTLSEINYRGTLQDPAVRRMLAYAMRDPEQINLRLKAVKALSLSDETQLPALPDDDMIEALTSLLANDPNDGVRLKVVDILGRLPYHEKFSAALLLALQRDTNAAVRIAALEALSRHLTAESSAAVEAVALTDSNSYVRLQAEQLLQQASSGPLR